MKLPLFFKLILWSYDFSSAASGMDKKYIIINTINYGDLKHWRWIIKTYGKNVIKKILSHTALSELRPHVVKLVALIFNIKKFRYARRRIN